MCKVKGFMLPMLLVTLALSASVIMALVFGASSSVKREVTYNIDDILKLYHRATELYYTANCTDGYSQSPTIHELKATSPSLNNIDIPNGSYLKVISIFRSGADVYFTYEVEFGNKNEAVIAAGSSNYKTEISGSSVKFILDSSKSTSSVTGGSSQYIRAFGKSDC